MSLPRVNATKRDAPHLWGGLRYQKFVTLCAWLDLREGEVLHVEKEEDFTVARPGQAEATQVRRTRAPLSLGREEARAMIKVAWARDPEMVTVYWTTSAPGSEGRLMRSHQANGLDLWGRAADGDDTALEAVRDFLINRGGWASSLADALRNDPPDVLRQSLFRRVRWEVRRPTTRVLEARVKAKLFARLQGRGLAPASAAKLVLEHVLGRIEAVAEKDAESRHLDAVDLDAALEEAILLARNTLALGAGASVGAQSASPSWAMQALDTLRLRLERAGLEDLETARTALAEGRVRAAIAVIDTWVRDGEIEAGLRAAALRLRAETSLALSDVDAAEAFAAEADACDGGEDHRLSMLILAARDPEEALAALAEAEGELAWLRAELLTRDGQGEAARDFAERLAAEADDPYRGRVRATAHAAAGDVKRALELIEPLRARFPQVELTAAAAVFHYVSAHAKRLSVAVTDWPAPTNPGLIRQSDVAQDHLRLAATLFAQAAERLDDPRQKADKLVWRLACLAGLPVRGAELDELVRELTASPRPHPGAVHWALSRSLTFDTAGAEAAFAALESGGDADAEDLVAHAALLVYRGAEAHALERLRQARGTLAASEQRLVDSWIERLGKSGGAADPVSSALDKAQTSGAWEPVEALALEERLVGDRFTLLQILAGHERWKAVAAQADFLVGLETAEGVRVAALALYNSGDTEGALRILDEKVAVFPGGERPDDLTGIYIEALAATGRLPEAFAQLASWTPRSASRAARMVEIRLRLNLGDLEGVASRAAELRVDELPAAYRLQIANQIAPAAPEQARALLSKLDLSETPISLAPMAYEAAELTRLDRDRRREIVARLFSGEAQAAGVVATLTTDEIMEMVRTQSAGPEEDQYAQGEAMLHRIAHGRIGRAFVKLLTGAGEAPDLYVRDASALAAEPIDAQVLRLDITALITAHALGLIDALYANFTRVEIAPHLPVALQVVERDLHVGQPEKLEALKGLLERLDSGRVQVGLPPAHARRLGFADDAPEATCGDVVTTLTSEGRLPAAAAAEALDILGNEARGQRGALDETDTTLATNAGVAAMLQEAGVLDAVLETRTVIIDADSAGVARADAEADLRRHAAAQAVAALRRRVLRDVIAGRLHRLPDPADSRDEPKEPVSPVVQTIRELRAPAEGVAIWVEDRALHIRRPLEGMPIVGAYDVVAHLQARQVLSDEAAHEAVRRLREAGFRFLPITDKELVGLLAAAPIDKGEVVETPELAACRRAVARDLICERSLRLHPDPDQPTAENRFAFNAIRRFDHLLKAIWDVRAGVAKRRAWSDWAWLAFRCDGLERTPIAAPDEAGRRAVYENNLASLMSLGLTVGRTAKDRKAAYEWAWSRILAPELEADPTLATALPARFTDLWTMPLLNEKGGRVREPAGGRDSRISLCLSQLLDMPEAMRDLLLEDHRLRRFLAPKLKRQLTFADFTFQSGPVLSALISVWRSGRSRRVTTNGEVVVVSRDGRQLTIRRGGTARLLRMEGDILEVVVGAEAGRKKALARLLGEDEYDPKDRDRLATEIAAFEDPYERLVLLSETREASVAGRIELIRQHAQQEGLSLGLLKAPPPKALRRWLRTEAGTSPDPARLHRDVGPSALERLAGAPLRVWSDIPAVFSAAEIADYVGRPVWDRSPIGDLLRLRLLAPGLPAEELREAVVAVTERFHHEGEAFVELVRQVERQADRDADWRAEEPVFRSLAMWVWADIVWRALISVSRDAAGLARFWKEAVSARPRDLVWEAGAAAAMASPAVSAARLLATGLEFALGDRREEGWTEADTRDMAKQALEAAKQGKPLGPLTRAPDRDVTWLADLSPFVWQKAENPAEATEAVALLPEDQSKLALIAIGGPDLLDEAAAEALLAKLEQDPVRNLRGDHWIADLRFAAMAARALLRRDALTDPLADRVFALLERMVADLRQRDDWKKAREAVYHHIVTLAAALPAERIAAVLAQLFDPASHEERVIIQRVAGVFLAALPFEARTPVWREHLRMRWRL